MAHESLKRQLLKWYHEYHDSGLLREDPLGSVSSALLAQDFEIVSFITAGLSYGKVEQIKKSVDKLWTSFELSGVGKSGHGLKDWLVDNSRKTLQKEMRSVLRDWRHRFNDGEDIVALSLALKNLFSDHASLADLYAQKSGDNPVLLLENFSRAFRRFSDMKNSRQLNWFSCAPSEGSTCKRIVMWLRWMLRNDQVDPGLWSLRKVSYKKEFSLGPHLALVPVDTHIFQWAVANGLTTRKNPSWKTVEEVTGFLRTVDPRDPAKFDFCICHAGMRKVRQPSFIDRLPQAEE